MMHEMCDVCNEVNAKHESNAIAIRNTELEPNVAELLKENESLKIHCKELCDSIKETKTKIVEQTTSLIAKNDEFKAQLQEKGFTITALKNELRKATGNSVNTKFAKPSILGKLVSQPNRNQSVVRQPNAFRYERPKFSKTWFTSQVDAEQVLTKPVTPHYFPKIIASCSVKPQHVATPTPSFSRIGSKTMSKSSIKIRNSCEINDLYKSYDLEKARKRALLQKDGILGSRPCRMPPSLLRNTAKVQPVKSRIYSKSSTMHKKLNNPRPCHKWIPTGRIFKNVGLKWIPTRKLLTNGKTKVESGTSNGIDVDFTNPFKCKQTLNVSACSPYLSAGTSFNPIKERLRVWLPKRVISHQSGVKEAQL